MTERKSIKVLTASGLSVGVAVRSVSGKGWKFIPHTDAHTNSTKFHPTALAATPAWARKLASDASMTEIKEAV